MTLKHDTDFKTAEKLEWLKSRLMSGDGFTLMEIVQQFAVSERTAKRYIAILKKNLNTELSLENKRYSLQTKLAVDAEQMADSQFQLFYAFVKKLGEEKVFSPLITNRWLAEMRKKLPARIDELSDKITYLLSESEESRPTVIKEVFKAFTNRRVLEISYQMPGRKAYTDKVVPWQLLNHQGRWYLVAKNISRDYTNYYRLTRIKEIKITGDIFIEPTYTEVQNFIKSAFGIGAGNEVKIAKIRFYPPVAATIEEIVWHNEQRIYSENDCKIMELPYGFSNELLGRVLRNGQFAEILEPIELREEWLTSIRAMSEKFL